MKRFAVAVTEVRHVLCRYEVEAETAHQAEVLAAQGETQKESDIKSWGVFDRIIESDAIEINEEEE